MHFYAVYQAYLLTDFLHNGARKKKHGLLVHLIPSFRYWPSYDGFLVEWLSAESQAVIYKYYNKGLQNVTIQAIKGAEI